jgi:hypothetical protein
MSESIAYLSFPLAGVDAMRATTTRSYPRHAHDQYGIGMVDDGGHSSWSGRGQVEAGPRTSICCNPAEITDGRPVGHKPRSWRMLYLDPMLVHALRADVLENTPAGYIPKLLSGLGLFASVMLAGCTFAFIVFPDFSQIATIGVYGGPIFVFEVAIGLWLLLKGLRPSGDAGTR